MRGPSSGGAATGTEVTLPALGESVTEGTVSRWLKAVGDAVAADEPLLEVSTDKVDTEIPSPVAGTVLEIRVQEDETVEVGAVLAVIGDHLPPASPPEPAKDPQAEAPEPETATDTGGEESPSRRRPATKAARHRSRPPPRSRRKRRRPRWMPSPNSTARPGPPRPRRHPWLRTPTPAT